MRKEINKLAKMEKTKKNKTNHITFKEIFGTPYAIIVVLILFVIGLLFYSRYLVRCNTIYSYSGFTKDFSFLGGVIYDGPIVNHFGDAKIIYTGEDISISDYELGFYIKYEDDYKPIAISKGYNASKEDDEKKLASLKDVVTSTSFSFTETDKDAVFLSKENVENLKNMVFRIQGKDKKGETVEIEVPMVIEKITK